MTIRKSIQVETLAGNLVQGFLRGDWRIVAGGFGGKDTRLSMELRVGGRFFETRTDGTEYEIERLTAYRPTTAAGRAEALRWLFFLSTHISPPATDLAFNRIAVKLAGLPGDEAAIARGEKALPDLISIVEGQLAKGKWMMGDDFTLVDCGYGPVLNVVEKAGFSFGKFPKVSDYLDALRARSAWKETPKLPGL